MILPNANSAGKWTIIRNDDFIHKDGVEGDVHMYCLDDKHIWAIGAEGLIPHTSDGGNTWTKTAIESENTTDFLAVYFWDANVGLITGRQSGDFRGERCFS